MFDRVNQPVFIMFSRASHAQIEQIDASRTVHPESSVESEGPPPAQKGPVEVCKAPPYQPVRLKLCVCEIDDKHSSKYVYAATAHVFQVFGKSN